MVAIRAVGDGRLAQVGAARQLGISVRQVKKLVRVWRGAGAAALASKRRGRPSARRIDEQTRQRWIDPIRQRYPDFGPTLALRAAAAPAGRRTRRE